MVKVLVPSNFENENNQYRLFLDSSIASGVSKSYFNWMKNAFAVRSLACNFDEGSVLMLKITDTSYCCLTGYPKKEL